MAIINAPANGGFFQSLGQSFQQSTDRATEVLMQERELEIAKQSQKLQEKQLELQAQQQAAQQAAEQQRIAIAEAQQALQEQLGRQQIAASQAEVSNMDRIAQLEERRVALQESLGLREADRGDRALDQEDARLQFEALVNDRNYDLALRQAASNEMLGISELALTFGIPQQELNRRLFGDAAGNPDVLLAQDQASWDEESGVPLSKHIQSQRLQRAYGFFGLSDTFKNLLEEELSSNTPDEVLFNVLTSRDLEDADKAALYGVLKIAYPDIREYVDPDSGQRLSFAPQNMQAIFPNVFKAVQGLMQLASTPEGAGVGRNVPGIGGPQRPSGKADEAKPVNARQVERAETGINPGLNSNFFPGLAGELGTFPPGIAEALRATFNSNLTAARLRNNR